MSGHSRRQFLRGTVGALAAYAILPGKARADVNSQIRVATIGLNGRGKNHIDAFADNLVVLCDCDEAVLGKRADEFEKKHHRKLETVGDYRKLLERSDIDAVSIATPSHSHSLIAIAAAAAGKHVYCEKPVSQCVWEGRQLSNAARHYDRLVQCGTQARSSVAIQDAVEYVRSGKLGKIKYVVGYVLQASPQHRQARRAAGRFRKRSTTTCGAVRRPRSTFIVPNSTTTGTGTSIPAAAISVIKASTKWTSRGGFSENRPLRRV